jgi:hypothetical protein
VREAIDALLELEAQAVSEAGLALEATMHAVSEAEAALAEAERTLATHEARMHAERERTAGLALRTAADVARADVFARELRAQRTHLLERVHVCVDVREQHLARAESARTLLAEARARKKAVEGRIEARGIARKKGVEAREDEEAEEHRRR